MNGLEHATNTGDDLEVSSSMGFMNIAQLDRLLRLVVGLLMTWLGWHFPDGLASAALRVFALYPLISGLVGWCPIYALLGIHTRRR